MSAKQRNTHENMLQDLTEFMLKESDNGAEVSCNQPFRGLDATVRLVEVLLCEDSK